MIVVSNTTPLNYLILLGEIQLVERLYGRVLVPPAVIVELLAAESPPVVRAWAASPPDWIEIRAPIATSIPALVRLQAGEREAILLAQETGPDLLLMDERAGRRESRALGIRVAGTLAVLIDAGWQGLVEFEDALERLRQTTFHATEALFQIAQER